jgi:hypothetical protein
VERHEIFSEASAEREYPAFIHWSLANDGFRLASANANGILLLSSTIRIHPAESSAAL